MNWVIDKNGINVNQNKSYELSYPTEGNSTSYELEENGSWFPQRNDLIIELLKKYPFTGDFLDIGGGNGFQLKKINEMGFPDKCVLCEPGYEGCLNAKKRGIEYIYNGIFQDFPFNKFTIGAVGLFDVIEHIKKDEDFLNELYNVLPDKTQVYITVPAMKMLWSEVDPLSGHHRRFNKTELRRILQKSKFQLLESGYYFNFYFFPMLILRVIPYLFGVRKGKEKIFKEEIKNHKSSGFIHSLINKIHQRAVKKIRTKGGQLFGTSMYIVLKKVKLDE